MIEKTWRTHIDETTVVPYKNIIFAKYNIDGVLSYDDGRQCEISGGPAPPNLDTHSQSQEIMNFFFENNLISFPRIEN